LLGGALVVFLPWLLAAWRLVGLGGAGVENGVGDLLDAGDGLVAPYKVDYVGEGGWVGRFGRSCVLGRGGYGRGRLWWLWCLSDAIGSWI
jgi:hypothetical protein